MKTQESAYIVELKWATHKRGSLRLAWLHEASLTCLLHVATGHKGHDLDASPARTQVAALNKGFKDKPVHH